MSTEAQIAANRTNAQASCGPRTAEGRARVSRNAVSHGLYSSGDFVRPDEHDLYSEFCADFRTDLAPTGAIEETLAAEIIHAAWRMRRCSAIEATMMPVGESELDPLLDKTQQSVDRARAEAHRLFHRAMAELRRLQTERRFRGEILPAEHDTATLGLASYKDMAPVLNTNVQRNLLLLKRRRAETPWDANGERAAAFTKQTQSAAGQPDSIRAQLPVHLRFRRQIQTMLRKRRPAGLELCRVNRHPESRPTRLPLLQSCLGMAGSSEPRQ